MCGCGVRGHIVLYDECTEEQQLYAWWMECPGRSVRVRGGVRLWGISRVVPYCKYLVPAHYRLASCGDLLYVGEVCHIHCARYGLGQQWREVGVACLEGKSDLKWEGIAIRLRLADVKVWHVCGARM